MHSDDAVLDSSGAFTLDPKVAAEKYGKLYHRVEEAALYCISTLVGRGATVLTWETRSDGWRCRVTGSAPLPPDGDPFWTAWDRGMAYFCANAFSTLHLRQRDRTRVYKGAEPGANQHDDVEWVCAGAAIALDSEYIAAHLLFATFLVEGLPRTPWSRFLPASYTQPSWIDGSVRLLAEAKRWEAGTDGLRDIQFPLVRFRSPSGRSVRNKCVGHVLVAQGLAGPSEIRVVQNGVALQAVPWSEAPEGICAVVHAPPGGVPTDLSGRSAMEGEALQQCRLTALRAALPALSLCALGSAPPRPRPRRAFEAEVVRSLGLSALTFAGLAVLLAWEATLPGAGGVLMASAGTLGLVREYRRPEVVEDPYEPVPDDPIKQAEAWLRQELWRMENPDGGPLSKLRRR